MKAGYSLLVLGVIVVDPILFTWSLLLKKDNFLLLK